MSLALALAHDEPVLFYGDDLAIVPLEEAIGRARGTVRRVDLRTAAPESIDPATAGVTVVLLAPEPSPAAVAWLGEWLRAPHGKLVALCASPDPVPRLAGDIPLQVSVDWALAEDGA